MGTTRERPVRLTECEIEERDRVREALAERLFRAHRALNVIERTRLPYAFWSEVPESFRAVYRFAARSILADRVG